MEIPKHNACGNRVCCQTPVTHAVQRSIDVGKAMGTDLDEKVHHESGDNSHLLLSVRRFFLEPNNEIVITTRSRSVDRAHVDSGGCQHAKECCCVISAFTIITMRSTGNYQEIESYAVYAALRRRVVSG